MHATNKCYSFNKFKRNEAHKRTNTRERVHETYLQRAPEPNETVVQQTQEQNTLLVFVRREKERRKKNSEEKWKKANTLSKYFLKTCSSLFPFRYMLFFLLLFLSISSHEQCVFDLTLCHTNAKIIILLSISISLSTYAVGICIQSTNNNKMKWLWPTSTSSLSPVMTIVRARLYSRDAERTQRDMLS